MNLEKYNQRLLAIIGTLALVSLSVVLLISGILFVIDLASNMNSDDHDNTLVAQPTYDSITGVITRTQEISFESPVLMDSAARLYIIPVSQVKLEESEEYRTVLKDKFRSTLDTYGHQEYGNELNYYGRYNNLILYNQNLNTKEYLFPFKIAINRFSTRNLNGKPYLIAEGAKADSNKDGFLNSSDLSAFFIYEVASKKLTEISFPSMGFVDYFYTKDEKEILLSFATDKNMDGSVDEYQEPVILKILSIEKMEATDFIDPSKIEWLQKTVDH